MGLGVAASPFVTSPDMGQDLLHKQASRLPFVGREAEWATVQQVYTSIINDSFFLVVEGEAGMGRTRLAEEFLSSVRLRGAATIQARLLPGGEQPCLRSLCRGVEQCHRPAWTGGLVQTCAAPVAERGCAPAARDQSPGCRSASPHPPQKARARKPASSKG